MGLCLSSHISGPASAITSFNIPLGEVVPPAHPRMASLSPATVIASHTGWTRARFASGYSTGSAPPSPAASSPKHLMRSRWWPSAEKRPALWLLPALTGSLSTPSKEGRGLLPPKIHEMEKQTLCRVHFLDVPPTEPGRGWSSRHLPSWLELELPSLLRHSKGLLNIYIVYVFIDAQKENKALCGLETEIRWEGDWSCGHAGL